MTACVSSDILKIEHLWQFTSLTKLQLDNNIIEKIQGLEKLTNLVWLGEFSTLFFPLFYFRILKYTYMFESSDLTFIITQAVLSFLLLLS